MSGDLSAVVQRIFEALDESDVDAALALIASDAQGIDQRSRASGCEVSPAISPERVDAIGGVGVERQTVCHPGDQTRL